MPYRDNSLAINSFATRKLAFDEILKKMIALSQNNFGLDESEIRHSHCGELLYHTQILEESCSNLFTNTNKESS